MYLLNRERKITYQNRKNMSALFTILTLLYVLSSLAHLWEIEQIEIIKNKIQILYDSKDNKGQRI